MNYITSCVAIGHQDVPALNDMIEQARQVSYRTAQRAIGHDALASTFPDYDWSRRPRDLTMKRDWHVAYFRSEFRGKPVVYVVHSAIEYIFGD